MNALSAFLRWPATNITMGVLIALTASPARAEDVVLAVRQDALFRTCGLMDPVRNQYSLMGCYDLAIGDLRIRRLVLRVHPSVDAARQELRESWRGMSIPPRANQGEGLGEERLVWTDDERSGGTLRFRRSNVTISLNWNGSWTVLERTVRCIDETIRDDRQIAPLGRFDPPPEIVSVGIPDTLPVGVRVATVPGHFRDVPEESRYRFAPEFRGLGDPARLRVGIYELGRYYDTWNEVTPDGRSRPRIDVTVPWPFAPPLDFSVGSRERTPEEDGRFMLKLPLRPGPRRLVMVVANDDNVVVTKEFQVTFTLR